MHILRYLIFYKTFSDALNKATPSDIIDIADILGVTFQVGTRWT